MLPGAFSAYRYQALLDGPDGDGPLTIYLRGERLLRGGPSTDGALFGWWSILWTFSDAKDQGCVERNRYLAEDRVLSFEIVTKRREAWL